MYFGLPIANQDKQWVPHKVCTTCVRELRKWSKGKSNSFDLLSPVLWREPQNQIVKKMIENFGKMGCSMSIKLHFLNSHLDYFPDILGAVSEDQGERFHQDLKEIERRYQGKWNKRMMADYCWLLKRDDPSRNFKRKSHNRSFTEKKARYYKNI